jgi:hypothetical protein
MNPVRLPLLSCVNAADLAALRAALQHAGYHIVELDGTGIEDGVSFFQVARGALPLDPPLGGGMSWDAFSDSLWGGLDVLGTKRVAILWTAVERVLEHGLQDMLQVVECVLDVARSVGDAKSGIAIPVEVRFILVGRGATLAVVAALSCVGDRQTLFDIRADLEKGMSRASVNEIVGRHSTPNIHQEKQRRGRRSGSASRLTTPAFSLSLS